MDKRSFFNTLAVYKKEIQNYFYSPIGYVFIVLFLFIPNILFFFFGGIFKENNATMRMYFAMLPIIYIIFIPGLTMGTWSKEKNDGTLELLFTLPLNRYEILIGKFLSTLTIVFIALIATLPIPLITHFLLGSFDIGQLISQYIGALLMASCYIAISFFISSLTKELIVSFLLSTSILALFTFIGYLAYSVKFFTQLEWIKGILTEISLSTHFLNFSKGVIDSIDLVYYIGMSILFFYLNIRVLESKRWS
ncbi:MAG: ABC transporter permease subunit [Spirochaetes bacterium]|nr:ABC transporter permease subunit [Spirochaetota bacterium]